MEALIKAMKPLEDLGAHWGCTVRIRKIRRNGPQATQAAAVNSPLKAGVSSIKARASRIHAPLGSMAAHHHPPIERVFVSMLVHLAKGGLDNAS